MTAQFVSQLSSCVNTHDLQAERVPTTQCDSRQHLHAAGWTAP